jgi:hypothetical protein
VCQAHLIVHLGLDGLTADFLSMTLVFTKHLGWAAQISVLWRPDCRIQLARYLTHRLLICGCSSGHRGGTRFRADKAQRQKFI